MEQMYTTREAAKLLDVSLRTVQLWVESGALSAWKTPGGHRRIRAESLAALLAARGNKEAKSAEHGISVLIVEDDKALSRLYEVTIAGWGIPVRIATVCDGFEALMRIGSDKPDIIIADIGMPGMDGITMLQKIRATRGCEDIEIIVVSGLDGEEIQRRGGLPEGIAVFLKPAPFALIQAKIQEIANRKLHAEKYSNS